MHSYSKRTPLEMIVSELITETWILLVMRSVLPLNFSVSVAGFKKMLVINDSHHL